MSRLSTVLCALFLASLLAAALLGRVPLLGGRPGAQPLWRFAAPISETGPLDLDALESAATLGFGGRLEPTGPTAPWALGSESHVPCFLLQPRQLEILLELIPAPGSRSLDLAVSWNGTQLHSGSYLEGRWHSLRISVPADLQLLGQNWIGLRHGSASGNAPSLPRQAAYRRIELRPLDPPAEPLVLDRAVVELTSAGWLAPDPPPDAVRMLLQTDAGPVSPGARLGAESLQALLLRQQASTRPELRLGRSWPSPLPPSLAAAVPLPSAHDAVLVLLDACRADALGAYGDPSGTTPHLDRIARIGRVNSSTFAAAAYTLASVGALLSGVPSLRNGLVDRTRRLHPDLETLPEALGAAGFSTAAFSASPYVTRLFGFDQGFETFHEFYSDPGYTRGGRRAGVIVDSFGDWLARQPRARRTFAYMHLREPHQPYNPPPPWDQILLLQDASSSAEGNNRWIMGISSGDIPARAEDIARLRALYQAGLAAADAQVGRVVGFLKQSGRLDQTLLLVVADHGEAFFEHQRMSHNNTVQDEMVHVPWLSLAAGQPERRLDAALCGTVDMAPAVAAALGVAFQPLSDLPAERLDPTAVSSHTSARIQSLRTARHKFIESKLGEGGRLYDVLADPREDRDLFRRLPVTAAALSLRLQQLTAEDARALDLLGHVPAAPLDAATEQELKALGYVE